MAKFYSKMIARLRLYAGVALLTIAPAATVATAQGTSPAKPPVGQQRDQSKPDAQVAPDAKTHQDAAREKAAATADPLSQIMKSGNLKTRLGRLELRDNLYALLATTDDAKVAKRIEKRLKQVWLAYGSDTVALLLRRAQRAMDGKKYDRAIRFLDAALDLAPDYAEAFNRRAYAHYQQGNVRGAVGDLRRALALDPSHFQALRGLGEILSESGNETGALAVYEQLLDVYPTMDGAQKKHDELRDKVKGRGI
ncbi:MAG: tetratricopeptide repeat protein [Pseudomonadota bacterium]